MGWVVKDKESMQSNGYGLLARSMCIKMGLSSAPFVQVVFVVVVVQKIPKASDGKRRPKTSNWKMLFLVQHIFFSDYSFQRDRH